jgi:ring-1,2-phenylacetyl-CoA epoxidase subunit PaaE
VTETLVLGAATASGFHPLVVASVEHLTDDAVAVTFDVPTHLKDDFNFCAGQSLTLRRVVNGVEHRRTYSICSAAGASPRIGVREIPAGVVSTWLVRHVRPGDRIEVQPPSGSFRANPEQPGRHLCIAAGSGITPILSIAATVLKNPSSHATVVYGNRTTSSVMFADELADLKNAHHARLNLIHVLSREPRDVGLFSGRLDAERLRALFDSVVRVDGIDHVWLCGPLGMLSAAREVLAEFGVPTGNVHSNCSTSTSRHHN